MRIHDERCFRRQTTGLPKPSSTATGAQSLAKVEGATCMEKTAESQVRLPQNSVSTLRVSEELRTRGTRCASMLGKRPAGDEDGGRDHHGDHSQVREEVAKRSTSTMPFTE